MRKQLEDTLAAGMKRSLEESDESDSQDDEDEDEESYSDVDDDDDDDDDDDVEIPPAKKQKPTPGGWFLTFLQPRSAQCFAISALIAFCLQCFDAVGWAAGRASGL